MADDRLVLHEKLKDFLGSENVYFQPPDGFRLSYPCIIYEFSRLDTRKADNMNYFVNDVYEVTYVDSDPDNDFKKRFLQAFPNSCWGRRYVSSNRYHDSFYIF